MLTTMTVMECNKCEHKDNYMFGLTPQKTHQRVKDKLSVGVGIYF